MGRKAFTLSLVVIVATLALGVGQAISRSARGEQPASEETTSDVVVGGSRRLLWASQRPDGSCPRGLGVASCDRVVPGGYEVKFTQRVRNCTWVAGLGNIGSGDPLPGEIATAARDENNFGVWIATFDSAGAQTDRPHHLIVTCP